MECMAVCLRRRPQIINVSGGEGEPQGVDGSVDEVPAASASVHVRAREQQSV